MSFGANLEISGFGKIAPMMKRSPWERRFKTLVVLAGMLLAVAPAAAADGPVTLTGKAAEAFIAKYFPNAYIPGDVSGKFHYHQRGRKGVGHAKCSVPAMGAAGDGVVSTCTVWY